MNRKPIAILLVALVVVGCNGAAAVSAPSSEPTATSPVAGTQAPTPTVVPPTVQPTARPTALPTPVPALVGSKAATAVAIAEGTLGMTMAEFISRYNAHLDQGQYPITASPEAMSEQVFQVTPDDAKDSTLLFVTNADSSLRSVTALSVAAKKTPKVDRLMAQLEAMVVWSTVATAASPDMSEDEANNLLGTIGLTGTQDFGSLALTSERDGVRYHVIETDEGTDLIIRQAN